MIRIQRVYSAVLPIDKMRIVQAQEIFCRNFATIAEYADKIPDLLTQPVTYGYKTILLVCETGLGRALSDELVEVKR